MSFHVCPHNHYLGNLLSVLRDRAIPKRLFRSYAHLLGDFLIEQAIAVGLIPISGIHHGSSGMNYRVVGIPILRAGNAFLPSLLRLVDPGMDVGQILIQRNERTAEAKLLLDKTPADAATADLVVVMDPMLATGGSVINAVNLLVAKGVSVDRILLVHGFAAPEGIAKVKQTFPSIRGIVAVVDDHLDERKFIVPGLGDFGDRYY